MGKRSTNYRFGKGKLSGDIRDRLGSYRTGESITSDYTVFDGRLR